MPGDNYLATFDFATATGDNAIAGVYGEFLAYRLADPVIIGDLSSNAAIDAGEMSLLNQALSGALQTRLPPVPTELHIEPAGPDPTLSLPTDLRAALGETVMVPVYLDTARPEGSAGLMEAMLALKYDPKILTGVVLHELTADVRRYAILPLTVWAPIDKIVIAASWLLSVPRIPRRTENSLPLPSVLLLTDRDQTERLLLYGSALHARTRETQHGFLVAKNCVMGFPGRNGFHLQATHSFALSAIFPP